MPQVLICRGCEERLTKASNAMRRHASVMYTAIQLVQSGRTEELKKDFTVSLLATLMDAESAWDTYRKHLIEHGLLPAASSAQYVA
jgi:hypothetical protein